MNYEKASPLDITLELARTEDAGDPFAFRFGEQTYLVRREGGAVESAAILWNEELLADLAALGRSDPVARQRVGERVRAFVAQADWGAREREIAAALKGGRRVHVTLRSSAAELYLLPWELLTLKATGQHLGELPDCLVRYEWPATVTAAPTPDPPPEGGRILFAWSAAGGAVAVAEHLEALRRAAAEGHHLFDPARDVLPHVSLASLHGALTARGPPFAVLHLLCHGGRLDTPTDAYGLVWDPSPPESALALVDAGALRRVLERHKGTLRLVVLSTCYGGNAGAPGNALGAVAQELHRIGIPAIIASRQPVSVPGSIALTEALYRRLLVDLASLEDAFLAARARLTLDASSGDWASLQLYARVADGADHRPIIFRPYRGLAAFRPAARRFFFGREREIDELVEALDEGRRLLTLVGASGSGKSSLAMAGLVPAVVEDRKLGRAFRAAILRPGAHPCAALAAAMASLGGETAGDLRLLLVVDQVEELFTQVEDRAEAVAFVTAVLHATALPEGRMHAVLTLRADFLGRCLDFDRELAARVKASTVIVLPMSEADLRQAILRPAALAGLRFDDGLVEALLDALREGSAASDLPLLAFALEALWERRRGSVIPWAAWESIGGLKGAIAQRADEVLAGCRDDEARQLVRDLFSRLVQLGLGTEDTRHYAARSELGAIAPERAEAELERWIAARLLTADEDEVWVAHEAVIRQWATLRRWIAEDREALLVRQELEQASRRWEDAGRSADELWRGARLGRASELREAGRLRLTAREAAFLEAAEAAQRAEEEAVEARRRKEIRRSRTLAGTAVFVALVVGMLGLVARWQKGVADQAALEAHYASLVAGARERLAANQPGHAATLLLEVKDPGHQGWAQVALDSLGSIIPSATLRGHTLTVMSAAFSPDGRRIVTASGDRTARVWNADGSGEPIVLRGHDDWVMSAAFSLDSRHIVTASWDKTARIWNADGSGEPIVLRGHTNRVMSAAFSSDGKRIVTTSGDKTVRVWNADGSGEPLVLRGHNDWVVSAAFSLDGRRIVSASDDQTARVWNVDGSGTDAPLILLGHESWVTSAAFSLDGRRIVTASTDKTVRVWNAEGFGEPLVFRGHEDRVFSAAFSPDGARIVTASADKTARVWNADGSDEGHAVILHGHEDRVFSAAFSSNGRRIVTASSDRTARVWNLDSSGEPRIMRRVGSAAFSPDGARIVTASEASTARVWNADGSGEPLVLRGHQDELWYAAFSPDGRRIVTASKDKTARVWSADGPSEPLVLRGHEDDVLSAVFSPDGQRILTTSFDETARVWNADGSGKDRTIILRGHKNKIVSAEFSPDGARIVTASNDKTARVWNADGSGEPLVLRGHEGEVASAGFSPDGRLIVTASYDKTARVWNANGSDKNHPLILRGHGAMVNSAKFSPDGQRIVTASDDQTARVWNVDGSGEALVLRGHKGQVSSAAFSPDGQRIVTASGDNTARVWNADGSDKNHPLILHGQEDLIWSAEFSPDGTRVLTASGSLETESLNGTARVWSLSIPLLQQSLRTATTDCLPPDLRRTYLDKSDDDARAGYEACEYSYGRVGVPDSPTEIRPPTEVKLAPEPERPVPSGGHPRTKGTISYDLAQFLRSSRGESYARFVFDNLNFEFGSAWLTLSSFPTIDAVAMVLKAYPNAQIRVEGHTDNVGSPTINEWLARSRAYALKNALVARGVDANRLTTAAIGQDRPIASNDTAESRAKNRRAELVVTQRQAKGSYKNKLFRRQATLTDGAPHG